MAEATSVGAYNLAQLADDGFERHGDHESTFFEGRWHRTGELRDRYHRVAGGFVELGIRPGDRVVVLMANSPEVGLAYHALWRAGAVITPVIFLLPPDQIRHVLRDSEARAVVTTPEFIGNVRAAAGGVDTLHSIIVVGDAGDGDVVPWAQLEAAEAVEIVPRADDDLAALLYTGGTTGRSKGVMLTHENLWFCAKSSDDAAYIPGVTRVLVPLPLAHAFGLIVTIIGMHAREPTRNAIMRWFDPAGFVELVEELRMQRATLVPTMLQILLQQPLEDHDLSSLRFVNVGAAPLPMDVALEFQKRVPSVTILEGYGATESGGVISVNPADAPKLGSVGKPLPGYEIRITDDARDVPRGHVGEIAVRSKGVMVGYWCAPAETEQALRDGWLHTGDLGRLDEDGYLVIVDRKKDLIIRGGFNVFPRDVEDALVEHPAVAMAGVVGRPDPRSGEEVVAFVSLTPGHDVTADDLVAWAKERVGGYKYPREIRIVDQVPLTPVLKTDRKALRQMLEG
jgi:long-chain acyl-CoA synthetase